MTHIHTHNLKRSEPNVSPIQSETYHYKMCGLDYVYLLDGFKWHEGSYGRGVAIKKAEELDTEIAVRVVYSHARMRGQEVRFLRSLLEGSQSDIANELGVKRLTVARWESKPNTPIPGPADRLLRIIVARRLLVCQDCLDGLIEFLPEISDQKPEPLFMHYEISEPNLFSSQEEEKSGGWTEAVFDNANSRLAM